MLSCHKVLVNPTEASFQERDAFLSAGAMHGLDNPNADSIRFFSEPIGSEFIAKPERFSS